MSGDMPFLLMLATSLAAGIALLALLLLGDDD